ncbi:MAG TPA: adenylate/guanylate cyclase domain-containing protein [Gaiellaceae bacterium]|nr:adenylate/guanylate cyclase domain-containing protein [Gaiellaceae bacterium]
MRQLPTGTVTFLFTDIEGSTRLLHELGDAYAGVLAEHRRAVRDAFGRYRGVEVDTQGDAFFFAFARASDAVLAAEAAQGALAKGPVRVRMGLHTGEPIVTDEGYVGADVHRAARVMSAGHGGQVLVSGATARLLDSRTELTDLGEHRLKDLSAPERLYQLGEAPFPPLKTLYRTNLPVVTTPLVGRERELEEAGALVCSHRLVTLTGPGGSGKTRLAVHLAADAADDFPDGVYWVPLQAIRDPANVAHTIAAAVGADDDLIAHVGSRHMLVLLDNFEQVVEASPTVSSLLAGTPNAKVLVTSREPLDIASEQRYPVDPLRLDDAELLFNERAHAVMHGFRPTPEVKVICEHLDRLPLAIELAAARVALLDPGDLLARLDQRLPLLASRSRDAPARQRTLRATIEWSYELLDANEQQLFRRMGAFRGSFSLEAAESVCGAELDTVESLVVKNLLRRRWGTGRLLMLNTIREYSSERLEDSPEAQAIHRRHAEFFLDVARSANLNAGDLAPGGQRLDVAFEEQDNLRGALSWALRNGEIQLGLELATALEQFWVANDPAEGVRWFHRALVDHPATETAVPVRAHALRAWGSSTHIAGDPAGAEPLWEQSLALFEEVGDEHGCAVILHRLSISAMVRGDLIQARELVESSHSVHARNEDWWQKTWGHAQTTGTLGAIARDMGDDALALERLGESADLAHAVGVEWWQGGMLAELAALSLRMGRVEEAETHARESLAIAVRLGDRSGQVFGVGLLACVAAEYGELERAGRLWGAIEEERAHAPLGGWQRHRDACSARIRRAANSEFDVGLAAGRELELDTAAEEALVRSPN